MAKEKTIRIYSEPAGGWGALKATGEALALQGVAVSGAKTLLRMNQPEGFDCPGCAWPDAKHTSSFEFCENGAKAVAWEATAFRCTPDFFAAHSVTELTAWNDYDLEMAGRLTHPMAYDKVTDRYLPIEWDEAFALIAKHLDGLDSPNQADFYTSGRASNEAAFLYQIFVREFGSNNFPDCSNMCHEATSVGLPESIGVGKGTVLLDDFEEADAIFIFGQNPGTNSPRMMSDLYSASRRGAKIVSFNPFRERALERFASPQNPVEMATLGFTQISSFFYQVRVGGDVAVLKGMMKAVIEADDAALLADEPRVLDIEFIDGHTHGLEDLVADLRATTWDAIVRQSGLSRDDIQNAANIYMTAKNVILVYGMGLTQHHRGTETVQQIANLALLRGNIGRPGAGVCPVRGHSNVQGNRTVGITEKPSAALIDGIQRAFGFRPPAAHGHDVIAAIDSMMRGEAKVFIALGGNFAAAVPDWVRVQAAMRELDLTVHIATKLNRSHLVHGKDALILPCLGRTEVDIQADGPQSITVEDSMSMVHASGGRNEPASPHLKSEPAIVAGIARATLGPDSHVEWEHLVASYDRIRDKIEIVYPIFQAYNERIRVPGGFHLASSARERVWATSTGRANFFVFKGLDEDPVQSDPDALWLTTMRSHDQYNTTLYSHSDRYRGVFGQRDVIFLNPVELRKRNLHAGDRVDVFALSTDGIERVIRSFMVIEYVLPDGCCGAYYPEANPLVPLYAFDQKSRTPSYKSVPVKIVPAASAGAHLTHQATGAGATGELIMHLSDVLDLSRAQFAMTAIFHILWPILTISLSAFLVLIEVLWLRTGNVGYYRHARFWSKLLVLNFAVGVVSGIPMEFQFGTNWAGFSRYSGQFFGNILGFEGAMAFMLEAGFIGVMLLGWSRVPRGVHLFATSMVALGSSISAFWIMVANSWMQTPAGVTVENGKIVVTDYAAAIFNPDMVWGVTHMWVAAIETGMFVIAGISAWNLFKRRNPEFFARSFKIALLVLVFVAPIQVWLGDSSGGSVFATQPAKGAAIEGHWTTNKPGTAASWSLLAWPNQKEQRNDWSLEVPGMLSILATHTLDGEVKGLKDFAPTDQPPALPLLYYAFRVMAGIGFAFTVLAFWTAYVLHKTRGSLERLLEQRKLLLAWVLCIPLPYVAVEAGWIVREVGRQPWVVYGLLRTKDAVSTVAPSSVTLSIAMFFVFYVVLLGTFFVLARNWLRTGPDVTLNPPAAVKAQAAPAVTEY